MLESEDILLSEVEITADGKDPAYRIMNNAIKKRKYYLNLVNSYSVDVYMKGLFRMNEIPENIPALIL